MMKTIRRYLSLIFAFVMLFSAVGLPSAALGKSSASIKITGSKYVAKGKKITLSANQNVTWKTSDKKIATVSSKGVVKGVKPGKVTITAVSKADKNIKKTWKITVMEKKVTSVKITASTTVLDLQGKKSITLKATVSPDKAAKTVTWKSSNTKVAKVDSKGKVTAVGKGKAKITATATDGTNKKTSVTITVVDGYTVGISLPTNVLQRWVSDGNNMKKQIQNAGFKAIVKYADNNVSTQISQIESMIKSGCNIIVVTAVDSEALSSVLSKAKNKGITIIAYDRLLMNTNAVSYYVGFSSYNIGVEQGKYIVNALKLKSADGPFTLEITAGEPLDTNAGVFYNGAMSVLKPYIDSGKLIVPSGQISFNSVQTSNWMTSEAKERAQSILSSYYSANSAPDAWLCSNDSTAAGVIQALENASVNNWPVITGQDCDNVQQIKNGKQSMSIYRRTIDEVAVVIKMINSLAAGKTPSTNTTVSNGSIKVPTAYAPLVIVTKSNVSSFSN